MIGIDIGWGRVWFSLANNSVHVGLVDYEFHVDNTTYQYGTCTEEKLFAKFEQFVDDMRKLKR